MATVKRYSNLSDHKEMIELELSNVRIIMTLAEAHEVLLSLQNELHYGLKLAL